MCAGATASRRRSTGSNEPCELSVLHAEASDWENPQFSPDGGRISYSLGGDTWALDLGRGSLASVTSGGLGGMAVWSPDGRYLVIASRGGTAGPFNLYLHASDGGGQTYRLTETERSQFPMSWHPSGRFLALAESSSESSFDVRVAELAPDPASGWRVATMTTFAGGVSSEFWSAFSPTGEYLAYSSQQTGAREIYVEPFPGPGAAVRVSNDGGAWPVWSETENELLFGTLDGRIMMVRYEIGGGEFVPGSPELWTERRFIAGQPDRYFDLHPDGERVMLRLARGEGVPAHAVLVPDGFGALRRAVTVAE